MDRGAHLRLVGTEQEAEQRLRAAAGELRSLHLCGHESPDGEKIGSLMRLFGQFLYGVLRSSQRSETSRGREFPCSPSPEELAHGQEQTSKRHYDEHDLVDVIFSWWQSPYEVPRPEQRVIP